MNNNNLWSDIAEEIKDSVNSAIENREFSDLSQNISKTLDNATDRINSATRDYISKTFTINGKSYTSGNKSKDNNEQNTNYHSENNQYTNYNNDYGYYDSENKNKKSNSYKKVDNYGSINNYTEIQNEYFRQETPVKVKGIVLLIAGIFLGLGLFPASLSCLIKSILYILTEVSSKYILVNLIGTIAYPILPIWMIKSGVKIIKRNSRFKIYKKLLDNKKFIEIKDISNATGLTTKYLEKDLRTLIEKKYFTDAHIDDDNKYLFLDRQTFEDYEYSMDAYRNSQIAENASREKSQEDLNEVSEEIRELISEGRAYIIKINDANDKIPGEEVSNKLDRLQDIVTKIFDKVKKQPEKADELRKLMKYYLPTTIKLLDVYIEMDGQTSYETGNIEKTKKEIEDSLDVINTAFEKLFDDLFEETAWEISSDIAVMKNMMAQDGLTENKDFK